MGTAIQLLILILVSIVVFAISLWYDNKYYKKRMIPLDNKTAIYDFAQVAFDLNLINKQTHFEDLKMLHTYIIYNEVAKSMERTGMKP